MTTDPLPRAAVFVGRQPIFDRHGRTAGFELLFRDGNVPTARIPNDDDATHQVLANALSEFGLDQLVGSADVYLNVTTSFLAGGWHRMLPPDRTVLEILEHVPVTDELLEQIQLARGDGYRIAADDVVFSERDLLLLPHVDIAKVDLLAMGAPPDDLSEWDKRCTILAEKVETHLDYHACRQVGFDLFQGFYFTKPEVMERRPIDASRLAVLRLIAELETAIDDLDRVRDVIESDPGLTYKLLRAANSGFFSLPRRVVSARECVMLLGTDMVRRLAVLLAMGSIENKPVELAVRALVRARLCETAAREHPGSEPAMAFTVGLLSVADALADQPLDAAISALPLDPAVQKAIVERQGPLGELLSAVLAWERGELGPVMDLFPDVLQASDAVADATRWAGSLAASGTA